MATTTTNLGLTKPSYSDTADIAVINENMDKLDTAVNASEAGLAIMSNNNNHAAISKGQYVYVRKHGTLSEGLYKATANIATNGTLSSSNVTTVGDGLGGEIAAVANDVSSLSDQIATLIKSKTFSVTTQTGGLVDINSQNLGYNRNQCIILALATDISTGDTVFADVGIYRASPTSWTVRFTQGSNPMAAGVTFNLTVWYHLL